MATKIDPDLANLTASYHEQKIFNYLASRENTKLVKKIILTENSQKKICHEFGGSIVRFPLLFFLQYRSSGDRSAHLCNYEFWDPDFFRISWRTPIDNQFGFPASAYWKSKNFSFDKKASMPSIAEFYEAFEKSLCNIPCRSSCKELENPPHTPISRRAIDDFIRSPCDYKKNSGNRSQKSNKNRGLEVLLGQSDVDIKEIKKSNTRRGLDLLLNGYSES